MMLFFTIKNILVILLQIYRMAIVCCEEPNIVEPEVDAMEAVEEGQINDDQNSSQKALTEVAS
jgi:hypothetical protein